MLFQAAECRYREMEAVLADAKLLANRSNANNDYYLQVSSVLLSSLSGLNKMYLRSFISFAYHFRFGYMLFF
jgi:hypothetical protein